ncbi:MAG: biotin--[acetyl-CoA-carboxylase] ligase [Coriobacteriia bacterium]|nr:biotin--[acetyl-CoA-carboxylase] ligase [Coriobacteriia bacterium]
MLDEWNLHTFEEIDSTNERVKACLREGANEGYVVASYRQTGGQGRQGRDWSSPVGGLYMSFALRPALALEQQLTLPLVVCLAVRETCRKVLDIHDVQIKWPNDLLCRGAKICGISTDKVGDGLCIGIGLNVFRPCGEATASDRYQFGYTAELGSVDAPAYVDADGLVGSQMILLEQLQRSLLEEFRSYYERWLAGGFSAFMDEYAQAMYNVGNYVALETIDGTLTCEGLVRGVDAEGKLVVERRDGSLYRVHSGEIHVASKPVAE